MKNKIDNKSEDKNKPKILDNILLKSDIAFTIFMVLVIGGFYGADSYYKNKPKKDFIAYSELSKSKQTLDINKSIFLGNSYYIFERKLYYNQSIVDDADKASFEVIAGSYAKDNHNVFFKGDIIENAIPNKFKVLVPNNNLAYDTFNIYVGGHAFPFHNEGEYDSLKKVNKALSKLKYLGYGYYSYNNRVFRSFWHGFEKIDGADPATFQVIDESFSIDDKYVYFGKNKIAGLNMNELKFYDSYILDNQAVYYRDRKIINADAKSFGKINNEYSKDKNHVYYGTDLVYRADPNSFILLGNGFARDKYFLYNGSQCLYDVDPDSFKFINYDYISDKNYVFYESNALIGSNPKSFNIIDKKYSKDKNQVYLYDKIISGANPDTFEVINSNFSKDSNHVFYCGNKINGISSKDFDLSQLKMYSDHLYRLGDDVYYRSDMIEGVDIESFELFDWDMFKDKDHVYNDGEIIEGVDAKTFHFLNGRFQKDKNHVYGEGGYIISYNTNSFVIFSDNEMYGKDNEFVYYKNDIIDLADPETFQVINIYFCKDKNYVYNNDIGPRTIIKGADPKTFEVIYYGYSKDKNNVYYQNKKLVGMDPKSVYYDNQRYLLISGNVIYDNQSIVGSVDIATFEQIGDTDFFKDQNSIYHRDGQLIESDRHSFVVRGNDLGFDKNYIYFTNKKLIALRDLNISYDNLKNIRIDCSSNYLLIGNTVYYEGELMENVDGESFAIMDDGLAQDRFFIYKEGKAFRKKASTLSIKAEKDIKISLNNRYYLKGNNVFSYNERNKILDLDSKKIRIISWGYITDGINTYYESKKINISNPSQLKIICDFYLTDGVYVYYNGILLSEIDVSKIKGINYLYIKDDKVVYYESTLLNGVKANDSHFIGKDLLVSGNLVYYKEKLVSDTYPEGFDHESFLFNR